MCAIGDDCLVIHKTIKWPRLPHITVIHCYLIFLPAKFATIFLWDSAFLAASGIFSRFRLTQPIISV